MNKILVLLLVIAALFAGTASASELSDYQYLIAHQDNARNIRMLEDLAYPYGSPANFAARMDYIATQTVLHVNSMTN